MKNSKFYVCPHCGNIVEMVNDSGVNPVCCGKPMNELVPNTVEASGEKHKPDVSLGDGVVNVSVGSIDHPMEEVHWIEWVQLNTDKGSQRKYLKPGEAPKVSFLLGDAKPLSVYAYCNIHGLWLTEL